MKTSMTDKTQLQADTLAKLAEDIKRFGKDLGFSKVAITDTDLQDYATRLKQWLANNYHGEMSYMSRNIEKRLDPEKLVPGTKRIISVSMDYLPPKPQFSQLKNPIKGFISRYALGRDYHKLIRKRLEKLAKQITTIIGPMGYRAFTDSAPVLEKAIAEKAGLGWIGKHTCLIHHKLGSWFFLGELYTDLGLPIDQPVVNRCGSCQDCIDVCPTKAIVAPYQLDARRCIAYLTIELKSAIPTPLRPLIGNRIYGCDDCQLICPWNKFATTTREKAFYHRFGLERCDLITVFNWDETTFLKITEGSAIKRIGHELWLRNVATALGNSPYHPSIIYALKKRLPHPSPLVREHVNWALRRQQDFKTGKQQPPNNKKLANIPEKRWLYLNHHG